MDMSLTRASDCAGVDAEFDLQFQSSPPPLSSGARGHIAVCVRCRELHRWIVSKPAALDTTPQLRDRARQRLLTNLRPVPAAPPARTSIVQFLIVYSVFSAAMVSVMGIAGIERMNGIQMLGIALILAIGITLFSAATAWYMVPGRHRRIPGNLLASAFGIGFLAGVALLFPWREPHAFLREGWQCSMGGIAVAAPAAVLFWLLVRRGAPLSAGALGASLGAMAGLAGMTVVQFQCTRLDALHLLVWHGGILAVSTAAGSALGYFSGRLRLSRNQPASRLLRNR